MKLFSLYITLLFSALVFCQNSNKEQLKAKNKANNFVYDGNELVENDEFVSAEMEYRKAISKQSDNVAGSYNLAHTYYKKGSFREALYRSQEAANNAITKEEKHKAFYSIGNILMQNKKCKEAVEAYKNALRNNPTDEEARYNLALAKECAKNQDGGGEDNQEDKDNKDQDKDKKEEQKQDENKDEKKEDEGDKDKKDGEDKEDENGKPKDDKKDDKGKGEEDKKDKKKPKPQPGKMSPQQIKNILDAMNNQEQKVQEKINAKKQKGAKVKTEKDW